MTEVRLYRPRISVLWWVRKPTYFLFVMRELSSFFVAWFVVYLLFLINAVHRGEAAYQEFLDRADAPWLVVLNVVGFAFVVLHTVTWFHLTPKAMVVRLGPRQVPPPVIIASQYLGLAVVSAVILWVVTS